MELTSIQERIVEEILSHYDSSSKKDIEFKAPTGSGKTLMATNVISSLIDRHANDSFVFVIATPSSSSLPFFFEQKINVYKKDLPFSKFEVEYIESPSSNMSDKTEGTPRIMPQINKVFIFGKSTFGKKRIFTERGIIDDFVQIIGDNNMKLIYLRDEAHIGGKITNDKETQKFEELMQSNAHFSIKMTATPDYSSDSIKVILKEKELNDSRLNDDKWLLKTNLSPLLDKDISDEDLLVDGIQKFKEIKQKYIGLEKSSIIIRPAMLIQVDNEPSDRIKKEEFKNNLDKIKQTLTSSGLSWVQYFGNGKKDSNRVYKNNFTLDEITRIDNDIDVVIFKIGPSTGWDIPRACVLMQLRNVSSSTLNTQTIGRIKRNPYPGLAKNDITDKYYIYSNAPKLDDDIIVFRYDIKNELLQEELAIIKVTNKKDFKKEDSSIQFKSSLTEYLLKNKNKLIQEIKGMFLIGSKGDFVYRKERISANNHSIYTEIGNVFIFLKEIERLKDSKKFIFDSIKDSVQDFYENELSKVVIENSNKLHIEYLYLLLLSNYTKTIDEMIRRNSSFIPIYRVDLVKYEPERYIEVYDEINQIGDVEDEHYLFDIMRNDDETYNQPVDSYSEKRAISKLSRELYKNDGLVKIWCKNLTSSNVNGEYLDQNHVFRKSFFDFIIKFANNSYLYIEVKAENDIDPVKTSNLRAAYKDYFASKEYTLFDTPIFICIWVVKQNGNIVQEVFYDKKLFSEELNTKDYKELISYLANFT